MMPNMQKNWRDLIKPRALEVDSGSTTPTYAKFVARPLERGFGTTLGNSLRRVLLSSLQGTAVAAVRIHGVQHEFSTINDIAEDVTEVILNIKEIRLRALTSANQFTITVEKDGEGVVRASDLNTGGLVEVLNPNHRVCSLGKEGKFKAEFLVKTGRGFVPAENNKNEDLPIGWIAVDSIFSPVRKVNYTVTQARVGQKTDYDKLQLEVWTDGSVKPEDAVALSSKIIRDQMTVFLNFQEEEEPLPEEQAAQQDSFNPNLYRTVDELELSVRSANCLQNANIKYIYELVQKTEAEMLRTKNFGRKSLNEIKEILASMGLHLGLKLDGFVPPAIGAVSPTDQPVRELPVDDLDEDDDTDEDDV
jgi:DNA-directed RNA polymerase subunit alpha